MKTSDYLNNILKIYKNSFDITKNYSFENIIFSAYGYFNSKSEKYLLVKEVNLWEINNFEHIFFVELDNLTEKNFSYFENLLKEKLEKYFIRNNNKYPNKNHMSSYITFIFICSSIEENLIKKIEKFKFEKNYLFSIRGFFSTKILAVDFEKNKIFYNKPAKNIKCIYENLLKNNTI